MECENEDETVWTRRIWYSQLVRSLHEHSPKCTWNIKNKVEWCLLSLRFVSSQRSTLLVVFDIFPAKLKSFVTIGQRNDFMWTWTHYFGEIEHIKKENQNTGNALFDALLKLCFQSFAADAVKKQPSCTQFLENRASHALDTWRESRLNRDQGWSRFDFNTGCLFLRSIQKQEWTRWLIRGPLRSKQLTGVRGAVEDCTRILWDNSKNVNTYQTHTHTHTHALSLSLSLSHTHTHIHTYTHTYTYTHIQGFPQSIHSKNTADIATFLRNYIF